MSDPTRYINSYRTLYAPWGEGEDEPREIETDSDVYPCDPDEFDVAEGLTAVDVAVNTMRKEGVSTGHRCDYSASEWQRHGWYSAEPYEHPYEGTTERRSFHLEGFTEDETRAIHTAMTSRVTAGAA